MYDSDASRHSLPGIKWDTKDDGENKQNGIKTQECTRKHTTCKKKCVFFKYIRSIFHWAPVSATAMANQPEKKPAKKPLSPISLNLGKKNK